MSSTRLQLVKWSFPTLAIILGLFWYKRRRVDRVDPGGNSKLNSDSNQNNIKSTKRKSISESSIQIDNFSTLPKSCPTTDNEICSSQRVSRSLDIPGRKPPASQPIPMKSVKSAEEHILWYEDEEFIPEPQKIKLGSNPKSRFFEVMFENTNTSSCDNTNIDSDSKLSKVCDNIIEEDHMHSTMYSSEVKEVTPKKEMNIFNVEVLESREKSISNLNTSESKNQTLSERDSANHSPVSGVLDGSLIDEARSEGSTDSGKGIFQ